MNVNKPDPHLFNPRNQDKKTTESSTVTRAPNLSPPPLGSDPYESLQSHQFKVIDPKNDPLTSPLQTENESSPQIKHETKEKLDNFFHIRVAISKMVNQDNASLPYRLHYIENIVSIYEIDKKDVDFLISKLKLTEFENGDSILEIDLKLLSDIYRFITHHATPSTANEFSNLLYGKRPGIFLEYYPFKKTDSLEKRLEIAKNCLEKTPFLMARNISLIFSDAEVVEDKGGEISKIINECLHQCKNTGDELYLRCSLLYYARLKNEKLFLAHPPSSASPSSTSHSSSSQEIDSSGPIDSHLSLFLGQSPSGNEQDYLFKVKNEYDDHLSHVAEHMNVASNAQTAVEQINTHLFPAIELSAIQMVNAKEFEIDHHKRVGFNRFIGGSGTFFAFPSPDALEMRSSALGVPFSIQKVQGISSSEDFVKNHWTHDSVVSIDIELVHDLIHIMRTLAAKIEKEKVLNNSSATRLTYEDVRNIAKSITEEVLSVCHFIKENSPSQEDLDMVNILETTAGFIYDEGTAMESFEDWWLLLHEAMTGSIFHTTWSLLPTYRDETLNWRDATIAKLIPDHKHYSPELIKTYWLQKRAEYRATTPENKETYTLDFSKLSSDSLEGLILKAASVGDIRTIQSLLESDWKTMQNSIESVLSFAALQSAGSDQLETLKLLQSYGVNIASQLIHFLSAATLGGSIDTLQYLMNEIAFKNNPNYELNPEILFETFCYRPPLNKFKRERFCQSIAFLLNQPIAGPPETPEHVTRHLLFLAAIENNMPPEILNLFIDQGCTLSENELLELFLKANDETIKFLKDKKIAGLTA